MARSAATLSMGFYEAMPLLFGFYRNQSEGIVYYDVTNKITRLI